MKTKRIIAILLCLTLVILSGCSANSNNADSTVTATSTAERNEDGYTLEQVVILSRHNIRSPLSDEGSTLAQVTTHDWFDWTSGKSELSLRGGVLETEMGQYFRKYLVSKGLMTENWQPNDEEVRIYANSMQRTIATANYFKSGFLPVSDIETEYHYDVGTMDPVFSSNFLIMNDSFKNQALQEIAQLGGEKGLSGITENLKENYTLLENVLDFKNSDYAKENKITSFDTEAPDIRFELNKEPYIVGTLDLTASIADALVLQYYEENGSTDASFGKELTADQWKQLAEISDMYEETIFGTYSISVNVAHPMLSELKNELSAKNRKVSYLCGHDVNILATLTAMNASDYVLPGAISKDTPIGCKLVIQKWKNAEGDSFATVDMVYQSVDQLQKHTMLDLNTPPMIYSLSFENMQKNDDGFYSYDDIAQRLDTAIAAFDKLPK